MKQIAFGLLCGFCFLLLLPYFAQAQKGGGIDLPCFPKPCPPVDPIDPIDLPCFPKPCPPPPPTDPLPSNCSLSWKTNGLSEIGYSYFEGSGSTTTLVGSLTSGVNGWVNFVVDHSGSINPYTEEVIM
jgi:hypothetical protein